MSKWKFRKPEPVDVRGLCVLCKKNPQKKKAAGYKSICGPCDKRLYDTKRNARTSASKRKYRRYLEKSCSRCGFIPEHVCQLDVHHLDEDHNNNDPDNLQTLCANCHRLIHKPLSVKA